MGNASGGQHLTHEYDSLESLKSSRMHQDDDIKEGGMKGPCSRRSKGPRVMETVQGLVHRGHMVEVRGGPVMQTRLRGNPVGQPKKGRIKVFKGLSALSDAEEC
jgi:hypothetical protein